jgi:hypothetical protein
MLDEQGWGLAILGEALMHSRNLQSVAGACTVVHCACYRMCLLVRRVGLESRIILFATSKRWRCRPAAPSKLGFGLV